MSNNISLTVRLPHELNAQLKEMSKSLGLTKTNLIRAGIHDFLTSDEYVLDFKLNQTDKKDRLVLNINQITFDILQNTCEKYNQSMNAVVTAVSILALERSAKWLKSVRK